MQSSGEHFKEPLVDHVPLFFILDKLEKRDKHQHELCIHLITEASILCSLLLCVANICFDDIAVIFDMVERITYTSVKKEIVITRVVGLKPDCNNSYRLLTKYPFPMVL